MMCHVPPNTRPVPVSSPEICESRSKVTQKFVSASRSCLPKTNSLGLSGTIELDMHIINEIVLKSILLRSKVTPNLGNKFWSLINQYPSKTNPLGLLGRLELDTHIINKLKLQAALQGSKLYNCCQITFASLFEVLHRTKYKSCTYVNASKN